MKISVAKVWFVISIFVVGVAYGIAAQKWRYFPSHLAERAWEQVGRFASTGPGVFIRKIDNNTYGGVKIVSEKNMQKGLTLISSAWKDSDGWEPELRLIDKEGKVMHSWRIDRSKVFQRGSTRNKPSETDVHGSYLFPDGDVLVNVEYVGTVRINACGAVQWTLPKGNHHSIARAENGSFWIPGVSQHLKTESEKYSNGFPGLRGREVWVEKILNISEDGDILNEINALELMYKSDSLDRHIKKMGTPPEASGKMFRDITHINDVEPLHHSIADEYPLFEKGDLMVSMRNLNLVFVFDPMSKKVKWVKSSPFIYQHDPDFVGEGWIGVFDNNPSPLRDGDLMDQSRIVFVEPHTDSTVVRFPTQFSDLFYTGTQGKWQMLENGNMLLTETSSGRVIEVDSTGRTVWKWEYNPTTEARIGQVTNAVRVDLTEDDVASWPCSSVDSVVTDQNQQKTQ